MRKIAGYLTKNRSGKNQKIAQSTHENEHIKPRKTFWRNSKQLLTLLENLNRLLANPAEVKNAVVLRLPMKYISISGCRYIQSRMQYIFNRGCSIYSIAVAVYIHFSGVLAVCGAHFIFIRLSYSETHLHLG